MYYDVISKSLVFNSYLANVYIVKRSESVVNYHACMRKIKMDRRGRILIPSEPREKLCLKPGTEFELIEERERLLLKSIVPDPIKVRSKKEKWGPETFLDAGKDTLVIERKLAGC